MADHKNKQKMMYLVQSYWFSLKINTAKISNRLSSWWHSAGQRCPLPRVTTGIKALGHAWR